ncbi:MAG: YfcE family phosphodiesterase [Ruminococcaceae bacterium]|nr:YfcE family phosphodiesterase [Oscillospiraceae bacterium]
MVRILVISDSHKNKYNLFAAIKAEPTAEIVYFLGDGYTDIEEAKMAFGDKKAFICVRGNCDFYCDFPDKDIRTIGGEKILATHGHNEYVKFGLTKLEQDSFYEKYTIALFGHTHTPLHKNNTELGVQLFNPGSIKDGCYGVIDITDNGTMFIHKKLSIC